MTASVSCSHPLSLCEFGVPALTVSTAFNNRTPAHSNRKHNPYGSNSKVLGLGVKG